MKPIDELIKDLEHAEPTSRYGDVQIMVEDLTDALHYLKEYQWQMTDQDGDHQQLEKAREQLQDFYRNDPLDWETLKQMEGKPVWVEEPSFFGNRWVIISGLNEEAVFGTSVGSQVFFTRDRQGDEWQAYRKERE